MALAGIAGLEPTHARIKIWCLTDLAISLYIKIKMGWVVGFEPTYTGATTLGLDHLTIPTMLVNFVHVCFFQKRVGDLERARTVDLQRDRLAF